MNKICYRWLFAFLTFFCSISLFGQTTYTWIGADNGSWATPANWSPTRTTPAANNILQFNDGTTKTITAVPTQTIGLFVMSGNTNITLQSSSAQTLTIGNGAGTDLVIPTGSALTLGTNTNVTLAGSAAADISGTLTINSGRTYNTNGTSVETTVTGSVVNAGTITNTTAGKLLFNSGSTYQHNQSGGTLPTATRNANSTIDCRLGSAMSLSIGGSSIGIGRLVVNNNTPLTLTSSAAVTLTVNNGTGDDLVVGSGSTLTIGSTLNITLASSTSADISGTLTINSGRTYNTNGTSVVTTVNGSIVNSGTVTNSTASKLIFSSGSTYQHSQDGGTIPTATWNANSTCLVTGVTGTTPGGLTQTFGNLTWNCTAQSGNASFTVLTTAGNFTLQSSGTPAQQMRPTDGSAHTIGGDYIQTGGSIRWTRDNTGSVTISGNFNLSGGTCDLSNGTGIGTINIAGNFSFTAGTLTETGTASGLIVFNGTNNQSFTGGGTISNTINFTINNSAGITLLTSITFPAGLTISNGNITTGANIVSLGTSVSNLGTLTRTSGTIIGNFRRWFAAGTVSNVLFPIGTSTHYRPANISFTSAITTGGTLTAFFTSTDPGTAGLPLDDGGTSIINAGKEGYWTINATTLAGGTYSLDLTADGFTGVSVVSTLRLLKRTTGGNWTLQGTHSAGTGTSTPIVHRTGMSGFSEFGVGGASDNPLPVELSSFSVVVLERGVNLKWSTETEVSNYGFDIERNNPPLNPLPGGEEKGWVKIGFVEGHGNSNTPKEYSFIDKNVTGGKYSYRLKQIDTDGQFEYSKVIEINFGSPAKFELSQNYPNPFNPNTKIIVTLAVTTKIKFAVYNLLGEQVSEIASGEYQAGAHEFDFEASGLASGVYIYKIITPEFNQSKKMMYFK